LTLGTPCWFGLAHLHHAWEVYKKGGRTGEAALRAAISAGESGETWMSVG
jgi:prenyl protein peptidase